MEDASVIFKSKNKSLFEINKSRIHEILNVNGNQLFKFDKLANKIKLIKDKYKKNIIVMKYEKYKEGSKILGDKFHKLNKNKIMLIRNNKLIKNSIYEKNKTLFIIKINILEDLININSMFYECSYLKNLIFKSKLNTNKVKDMSYLFYGCSSLKELPDISEWKTKKVEKMCGLFQGCSSI